jgi:hypothetical protein
MLDLVGSDLRAATRALSATSVARRHHGPSSGRGEAACSFSWNAWQSDLTLALAEVAEGYRAMDERRAIKTLLRP